MGWDICGNGIVKAKWAGAFVVKWVEYAQKRWSSLTHPCNKFHCSAKKNLLHCV